MSREVSPPPLKRRRTTTHTSACARGPKLDMYSWNINGIAAFVSPQRSITSFFQANGTSSQLEDDHRASLRVFLSNHDFPTLLFLQEVKINPDDQATQRAVEQAVKRQPDEPASNPDYIAHFSLPRDRYNATGFGRKLYGVCSLVRADFAEEYVERMREVDWDREGRFSVVETKAHDQLPKLAIFNVYMVNGTDHPYKDSASGAIAGTRHDRKLQVHRHLQAECRALVAEGFEISIAGDFNIARSPLDGHPSLRTFPRQHVLNRQDFEGRFLHEDVATAEVSGAKDDNSPPMGGLGMVDVYRAMYPQERAYSYYPRGRAFGSSCDRVDMILCSKGFAGTCVGASILATPGDRGPSDHVPIYAAFDIDRRFESTSEI